MGKAIPTQHPAVVLRSHFNLLRALLVTAMIAVVGLAAAVVILATDDERDTSTATATQVSTPSPTGSTRYDGGPEEGTRGAVAAQTRPSQQQAFPGLARQASPVPQEGIRYDGGPEEGSRGSLSFGSARDAVPGTRYDGGPEEGSRGSSR
jgi:hypothetical protein